ncbi:hypothetical protein [Ellagibacter sp.]|uniref:hypothetical protein n=1 Tax=Ellagibacter sp. TaxID=2137578 RepID=UPI003AB7496F
MFDFALDRALTMVSDYSTQLSTEKKGPEQKVGDFIKFLPVLAYDGSRMKEIDASEILDIAMAGTSATLLAKRWESALLVNVDSDTLRRLLANDEAINALMSIEGFRSLNDDIKTIINKSEAVKKVKKEKGDDLTPKEKKQLTEEEKEFKSKRKEIQEKLIKFATRIPIFMYLTDYREETLYDVITQLEPGLFKKVTGLDVADFNLLVSLGVFNSALMNDAVYKFRRYEDASLVYTGVDRHEGEKVGLYDTLLSNYDYLYAKQQESMVAPDGSAIGNAMKAGTGVPVAATPRATKPPSLAAKPAPGTAKPQAEAPAKKDRVVGVLESQNVQVIDRRPKGGSLWAIGGGELDALMSDLDEHGASFTYKMDGGKATGFKAGWWLSGYPSKTEPVEAKEEEPVITEDALTGIEEGTQVFHKSFGYGEVMAIDESSITVRFDNDPKKRDRTFMFPSTFYQGMLQL